jgi:hypothetical protein
MKREHKTPTTSLVGLAYFYSLVRYQEEELEGMKRNHRTTTTSLVGLAYFILWSGTMRRNWRG